MALHALSAPLVSLQPVDQLLVPLVRLEPSQLPEPPPVHHARLAALLVAMPQLARPVTLAMASLVRLVLSALLVSLQPVDQLLVPLVQLEPSQLLALLHVPTVLQAVLSVAMPRLARLAIVGSV